MQLYKLKIKFTETLSEKLYMKIFDGEIFVVLFENRNPSVPYIRFSDKGIKGPFVSS